MLKFFPQKYISRLCSCVDKNTPLEELEKLAYYICDRFIILNGDTCRRAESALKFSPACSLFGISQILDLSATLPGDHPGWRLLSLMVEHTGSNQFNLQEKAQRLMEDDNNRAIRNLRLLRNRLVNEEFTTMQPSAVIVWIECRLKTRVPPSENIVFPFEWKDIMMKVQLEDLASTSYARALLRGKIDMIFSMND
jgi:hypothetical protein